MSKPMKQRLPIMLRIWCAHENWFRFSCVVHKKIRTTKKSTHTICFYFTFVEVFRCLAAQWLAHQGVHSLRLYRLDNDGGVEGVHDDTSSFLVRLFLFLFAAFACPELSISRPVEQCSFTFGAHFISQPKSSWDTFGLEMLRNWLMCLPFAQWFKTPTVIYPRILFISTLNLLTVAKHFSTSRAINRKDIENTFYAKYKFYIKYCVIECISSG